MAGDDGTSVECDALLEELWSDCIRWKVVRELNAKEVRGTLED